MNCEGFARRLTDLREGVLGADERAELERHLAQCPRCRALQEELDTLERLCQLVKADLETRMPDEVRARIRRLIDQA